MEICETLFRMQEFDNQIADKIVLSEKLPEKLKTLVKNLEDREQEYQICKDALKQNREKQARFELDVKSNNAQMEKYDRQLLEISNNKEYKALNSEITRLKMKNSTIDDKELALIEEEKKCLDNLQNAKEKVDETNSTIDERKKIINEHIQKVKNRIVSLREQRNVLAKTLSPFWVKKYIMLIKNKKRKAVGYSERGACSECGYILRAQLILDLEDVDEPKLCENCGKILVYIDKDKFKSIRG